MKKSNVQDVDYKKGANPIPAVNTANTIEVAVKELMFPVFYLDMSRVFFQAPNK